MNFNPYSDVYHSLWDEFTCRGIEQHDTDIALFNTAELYAEHIQSRRWTYDGYLRCCEYSPQHSLALNPTSEQLKKNPYLYIITEAMCGDCDD